MSLLAQTNARNACLPALPAFPSLLPLVLLPMLLCLCHRRRCCICYCCCLMTAPCSWLISTSMAGWSTIWQQFILCRPRLPWPPSPPANFSCVSWKLCGEMAPPRADWTPLLLMLVAHPLVNTIIAVRSLCGPVVLCFVFLLLLLWLVFCCCSCLHHCHCCHYRSCCCCLCTTSID